MRSVLLFCMLAFTTAGHTENITIINPTAEGPATFAVEKLQTQLEAAGHDVTVLHSDRNIESKRVLLEVDESMSALSEAYTLTAKDQGITITGSDETGLMYGVLGLVEDFRNGAPWNKIKNKTEQPHFPFRAIKFNLPWSSYRRNPALQLNTEDCKDLAFWEGFLDMMAENRFNVLSLWALHPWPT